MENSLTVIHQQNVLGHNFQVYGTIQEPLFLAKDVASWIEHSDVSTMLRSVDEDEKVTKIVCTLGGNQKSWFLTESGLYEILMLSRKPIAKKFKKQVKAILHEIRTKGGYIAASAEMSDKEIMARALIVANATLARRDEIIKNQQAQLERQAPDVAYCREVLTSTSLHTINTIAVHLGISAIRLNQFLMAEGWIYKQGSVYCPSAKIRSKGYADFHVIPYLSSNGETKTREHLKWTEAGRKAVTELWNKRNGILSAMN